MSVDNTQTYGSLLLCNVFTVPCSLNLGGIDQLGQIAGQDHETSLSNDSECVCLFSLSPPILQGMDDG